MIDDAGIGRPPLGDLLFVGATAVVEHDRRTVGEPIAEQRKRRQAAAGTGRFGRSIDEQQVDVRRQIEHSPDRIPPVRVAVDVDVLERCVLFWLGGVEGRADAAARRLEADYPGATVVGTHHGYFAENDRAAIVQQIRDAEPHLVLVSFGNPGQEQWIDAHLDELGGAVAAGVGALVDRFAGEVGRPPAWVRRIGMEWFARLLRYPRVLWRRYLIGNPVFLWRIARNRPRILTQPRVSADQ